MRNTIKISKKNLVSRQVSLGNMMDSDYRDFTGKNLNIGDYVVYTQKKMPGLCRPLAYGIVESLGETMKDNPRTECLGYPTTNWPVTVVVKRMKPRTKGKYQEHFPCEAGLLIKIPKEEIMLRILEEGNSKFLTK